MEHAVTGRTRSDYVLWISTDRATRGGVSSMVNAMLDTELTDAWHVEHVATHRDGSTARKVATFVAGAARVLYLLVARRPRLVHIHTASYGSFVRKSILVWVAATLRVPVVLHVHGAQFHLFVAGLPRPLRRAVAATLTRCEVVIALGPRWSDRLREIAPRATVVVVPNSVRPHPPVARPGPGEPVRVLFLGRVGDRKGAFDLITAWHDVLAAGLTRPVHLTLAGDGDTDRARRLVADLHLDDSVDVAGWVDPARVPELVTDAHILVLPSHDEGQPMAVLEAMAGGLCVVTTPVGGIPDLVDETCAVLVTPGDVPGLAAALTTVIADDALADRLGRAAWARVRETFDVDVVWRRIDALYTDAVR